MMTTSTPSAKDTATGPPPDPPGAGPVRRHWGWWVAGLVVVAVAAGAWYWNRTPTPPANSPGGGRPDSSRPLPVVAAAAKKGSIDVYLNALGTVTPRNVVTVKPRVDGQLMSVAFREGQVVKAGDVLAEIDPRPFTVQLTQAVGQMAKDQALLKNAQLDLERYQTLLAQDSISKQQVDTQAALVRQYEGTVQSDQGAVDSARLQLTYARVTAPISGRVGLRQIDPGNVVHASDTTGLVVITQLQPITVIFPVPEDNVPRVLKRLQVGEAIPVEAWDRDGKVEARDRQAADGRQPDRHGDRHGQAQGGIRQRQPGAVPEPVRQRAHAAQHAGRRDAHTRRPRSSAARRARSCTSSRKTRASAWRRSSWVPCRAKSRRSRRDSSPGDLVVVDGADKLREGAKVELITREAQAAPATGGGRRGGRGDRPPGSAGKSGAPPAAPPGG